MGSIPLARAGAVTVRVALMVASALAAGCEATPPVAPTPTVAEIVILYTRPSRLPGGVDLTAYARDSDGAITEVSGPAQWASSNAAIVRVGSAGALRARSVSAVAPGTAVISASYQGVTGYLPIHVPPPTTVPDAGRAPRLSPAVGVLTAAGMQLRFTASVFANPQTIDVTTTADWTSSEPAIATVERGVVTAHRIGTTKITVTYAGASDMYFISVHPSSSHP